MIRRLVVVMAWLSSVLASPSCVETNTVACGPNVCSQVSVCAPDGVSCVLPSQVDACSGKLDGDTCSYPGVTDGACGSDVCRSAGCGNGVIEPDRGEVCDDGNQISFDGCSADCTSTEMCGDGITDPALGEQCDCGMPGMQVAGCVMENSDLPGATCRPDCHVARCGDGIRDPHEACDDGNVDPGDGCRADCAGRWTVMASGTYASLAAVWGTGKDNVYAVGRDAMLHYDGVTWTRMSLPFPDMQLSDIWGAGSSVFAVGVASDGINPLEGRLIELGPTGWQAVAGYPGETTSNTGQAGIYGRSASDFWVVNNSGMIQHWNGSAWSGNFTCAKFGGGNVVELQSVWTDPVSNRAYAAGNEGRLCTFDGSAWTQTAPLDVTAAFVWGASTTAVYALSPVMDVKGLVNLSIDGTNWASVDDARIIVYPTGLGGSPGDVILVGQQGRAIQFDGTDWSLSPTPTSATLHDVWGYAPGRAFIVGENGTILY